MRALCLRACTLRSRLHHGGKFLEVDEARVVRIDFSDEPVDVNGQPKVLDYGPQLVRRHLPRFVLVPPQRPEGVNRIALVVLRRGRALLVGDDLAKLAKICKRAQR